MRAEENFLKTAWTRHWPLAVAAGVLCAVVAVVFALCWRADGGHFIYAIDDIYIAMAVARNFAAHGIWGVTPFEFTSCESTFLWPLLLALTYALGGTSQLVPLLLNVVCAAAALLVVYVILRKINLPQRLQAAVLLGVVFLAPLPAMVFIGMEHTLQITTSVIFVYLVANDLVGEHRARAGTSPWIWILGVILPLIRYEGLFLVFAACLLLFARKRWRQACGLGAVAIIPLLIYGAISAHHGWYWLPNSVCLKANLPHGVGNMRILPFLGNWDGWRAATDVWATALSLLMLLALLVYRQRAVWTEASIMLVMVIITTGLHLRFARLGWFFRYEAYLIALSLVVFSVGAFQYFSDRRERAGNRLETMLAGGWLGYTLLLPLMVLGSRGYISLTHIPQASHNIYEQQYQMGLFVRQFYLGAPIAANDIGAVSYLGEPRLADLWGLASLDVAKLRMEGAFTTQQIDLITKSRGTKIAIAFDTIFSDGRVTSGGLPAEWIRVGSWKLFDNYICAEDTVSFYAVDPAEEEALISHLRQFASRLPPQIGQSGKYLQPN